MVWACADMTGWIPIYWTVKFCVLHRQPQTSLFLLWSCQQPSHGWLTKREISNHDAKLKTDLARKDVELSSNVSPTTKNYTRFYTWLSQIALQAVYRGCSSWAFFTPLLCFLGAAPILYIQVAILNLPHPYRRTFSFKNCGSKKLFVELKLVLQYVHFQIFMNDRPPKFCLCWVKNLHELPDHLRITQSVLLVLQGYKLLYANYCQGTNCCDSNMDRCKWSNTRGTEVHEVKPE